MKAKDLVLKHYPDAFAMPIIDNARRRTTYVIVKGSVALDIFPNEGAATAGKAWTNAKKALLNTKQ